jgi:regulator of protease activity HflC (stomatin/prohibitin superfamily)
MSSNCPIFPGVEHRVQIVALAKTTLRNIIGTMTLVEANSDRNKINKALYDLLSEETQNWGIEIVRTELKEIVPPDKVQAQMNEVVIAQNKMIAAADFASATETEADGVRRATSKRAEGDRQAVILRAEGDKQAVVLRAEGESEAIRLVNEAAQKYFTGNAQLLKQLETVAASLKDNAKIVLPEGDRLVNIIGNLAGIEDKKKT